MSLIRTSGDFNPALYSSTGAIVGCTGGKSGGDVLSGGKRTRRMRRTRRRVGGKRTRRMRRTRRRVGGKRTRRVRRIKRRVGGKRTRRMRGGRGYGFSFQQSNIDNIGHSKNLMDWETYNGQTINSDTNMNSYKLIGGKKRRNKRGSKKRTRKQRGGSYGNGAFTLGSAGSYYGYAGTQGEDLGLFAGSGYPPMSQGSTSECIHSPHTETGASPITDKVSA